jgi:hypothetical protein
MDSPCRGTEASNASVLLEDSTLDELSAFSDEEDFSDEELDFSELLLPIDDKFIPHNSIMREFLGGSAFEY